jgi:glutaconate CoA-transferase subunit B
MARRTAFIILQEKRRFIERNDYTTTPGWWCWDFKKNEWKPKKEVWKGTAYADSGPVAVVTNMGTYEFDDKGEIFLKTFHPGVTVEQVKENCGFDLNVKNVVGETKKPTYKELFVLREFVDPELIFLPQKVEYTAQIQKIIDG